MNRPEYAPIYELTRGSTIESVHYGAVAVVDPSGRLIASVGDPGTVTFWRSTAKPWQALPFIEAGGHTHFGLTPKEIALICASHSGTDAHVETARSIQAKVGITEADLQCGVHPPYHKDTADALQARGEELTPNRHNCSGKHSGMLAHAALRNLPLENYLDPSHPVQQSILQAFAECCDLAPGDVQLGTDGCSAPNFAAPLQNAALAWAHLADSSGLSPQRAAAIEIISSAMRAHPELVGGPERFDTDLMTAAGGKIVCKGGAEGYQGIGLLPGALGPGSPALGIAIKISDGDARRMVTAAAALEVLSQLGALDANLQAKMDKYGPVRPVYNWRKLVVGEAHPAFTLLRHD